MQVREELIRIKDDKYKAFTRKLVPDTKYEILGIKVPTLKEIAKKIVREDMFNEYLSAEHFYYEEWFILGFAIAYSKIPFEEKIDLIDGFLPHADNWAICDSVASAIKPKKNQTDYLYKKIKSWLKSDKTYTARFGIDLLIDNFTDEFFSPEIFDDLMKIKTGEYYIDMALAWYYSVILVKHYDEGIKLFLSPVLPVFIHNKSLQKARESFRIDDNKKEFLNSLKIKK